jgi:hypothetical protein
MHAPAGARRPNADSRVMSAEIIRFPIHPVRVVRANDLYLVLWRGCCWPHLSYATALADAHEIARAHHVRVIPDCDDIGSTAS